MCTSVAIGFYIKNEQSFIDFKTKILFLSREQDSIFSVYDKKPEPVHDDVFTGTVQKVQIDDEMDDDFCVLWDVFI